MKIRPQHKKSHTLHIICYKFSTHAMTVWFWPWTSCLTHGISIRSVSKKKFKFIIISILFLWPSFNSSTCQFQNTSWIKFPSIFLLTSSFSSYNYIHNNYRICIKTEFLKSEEWIYAFGLLQSRDNFFSDFWSASTTKNINAMRKPWHTELFETLPLTGQGVTI